MQNNKENNGEKVSMAEAIDDVSADVYSMYLHNFDDKTSEHEKIEKLAEMFNLSISEVEQIVLDEQ